MMDVERVYLSEAKVDDLKQHAHMVMGLDISKCKNADDLRALIVNAGWQDKKIPILQKASSIPAVSDSNGTGRPAPFTHEFNGKNRECLKIMIPEEEKAGGSEPVPVQLNGSLMYIPRAETVVVPAEFVEILENAEQFVYPPSDEGLPTPKVVKAYPFQYVH